MTPQELAAAWGEVRADLAALVWPVACVGCGAADRDLCQQCRARLREQTPAAIESPLAQVPAYARGPYDGVLREVIVAYKHAGRTGFAKQLGAELVAPLNLVRGHATDPSPLLVAAPSRAAQVRKRGYRPVDLVIAAAVQRGAALGVPLRALVATRGRRGQVGLDSSNRSENAAKIAVRGACQRVLRGREVIVVDDIITTGATVRAACDALADVGASVVGIAALSAVLHDSSAI